jgi:hypothetical protein
MIKASCFPVVVVYTFCIVLHDKHNIVVVYVSDSSYMLREVSYSISLLHIYRSFYQWTAHYIFKTCIDINCKINNLWCVEKTHRIYFGDIWQVMLWVFASVARALTKFTELWNYSRIFGISYFLLVMIFFFTW